MLYICFYLIITILSSSDGRVKFCRNQPSGLDTLLCVGCVKTSRFQAWYFIRKYQLPSLRGINLFPASKKKPHHPCRTALHAYSMLVVVVVVLLLLMMIHWRGNEPVCSLFSCPLAPVCAQKERDETKTIRLCLRVLGFARAQSSMQAVKSSVRVCVCVGKCEHRKGWLVGGREGYCVSMFYGDVVGALFTSSSSSSSFLLSFYERRHHADDVKNNMNH